jgi:hypothetical protein
LGVIALLHSSLGNRPIWAIWKERGKTMKQSIPEWFGFNNWFELIAIGGSFLAFVYICMAL